MKPVSSKLWGHWLTRALPRFEEGLSNAWTQSYMFLKTAKIRCFNGSWLPSVFFHSYCPQSASHIHSTGIHWELTRYIFLVYSISSHLSRGMAARNNPITCSRKSVFVVECFLKINNLPLANQHTPPWSKHTFLSGKDLTCLQIKKIKSAA